MIYPSVGQYTEAIKLAEQSPVDYFATMTTLRPILGADGNPVMSSGNFAVVFKMQDQNDGKIYALKCFTRDQDGRNESYRLIADELQYVESEYLTKIQYLEKELFVDTGTDDTEFPVLLMDWVEGETLDKYIRRNIDDKYSLSMLAFRFSRLAMWLMPQPFAHGDLKPDNILVRKDGSLVLVDYDGMYVPAMKGQKSRELGSPDFRHPLRSEDIFDEHIDDFSLSTILLSLKAISLQPSLLEEYGASDRLLFSQNDYRKISESGVLDAVKNLMQDSELTTLLSLFLITLTQNNLSQVSFRLLSLEKPKKENFYEEILSTEVTEEDIANGVEDEFGVVYSKDGKRLLVCNEQLTEYVVKDNTFVICDKAFDASWCQCLETITLPKSLKSIGNSAFCGCNLHSINLPDGLISIGNFAFNSTELESIVIPKNVTRIGYGFVSHTFCHTSLVSYSDHYEVLGKGLYTNGMKTLHSFFGRDDVFEIPNGVTNIGCYAFCDSCIQKIIIPNTVTNIEEGAFEGSNLQSVTIPNSVTNIGIGAFRYSSLQSITILGNVISINDEMFSDCVLLKKITISNNVKRIGDYAFCNCNRLDNIAIPDNVTIIGNGAFMDCSSLQNITIPDNVVSIGDNAFYGCDSLQYISIPNSVTSIGNGFITKSGIQTITCHSDNYKVYNGVLYGQKGEILHSYFGNNQHIVISNNVKIIADQAFAYCEFIKSITLPDCVKSIGCWSFGNCHSLEKIIIPSSVKNIGDYAFLNCKSLQSIKIPNNVTSIGKEVFSGCYALHSINIPTSVVSIGEQFIAYSGINSIECNSKLFEVHNQVLYYKGRKKIHSYFGHEEQICIPYGVTTIGDSAFYGCNSRIIIIPNSVTTIGNRAFSACQYLQSISFPKSVESIGEKIFDFNLPKKIVIPKGFTLKYKKLLGHTYARVLEFVEQPNKFDDNLLF